MEEFVGTGRRKTAVASVRVRLAGSGQINVNGRPFEEYFCSEFQRKSILSPLEKVGVRFQDYNFVIRVSGGGVEAQAIAARLGLSRALVEQDGSRRQDLKALGYLSRDSRKRERKKYGRAGARKRFQFSKR